MAGLKNNYQFEFTDTLTTSGMSVRISNEKENGAVATFTDQYVTARSEDNSIVERMKGSASAGVLTLSMRGLDQTDTDTQVPGLKRERREGTKVFVTYVASQHVDAKGNNTFSGTQTFENITVSNNSALTNATVSGKYKGPVVADVIARDALYPTPVGGNEVFVQSLNAKQVYNAGTSQRETQAVGTPAPDATDVIKGIQRNATTAEVVAGTLNNVTVTPQTLSAVTPEALVDRDTYILGEDCLVNDSLFVETAPTFAESTLVQNIGDVTANTRISIISFGSGVSGNTMQLALRKFVSPSVDLAVRLETVDGSGNPTGTLVNANATATVTAASLTTSLVDTTITFAGSFTIPKGQKYAIVLNAVGNVVNGTNYYGIGFAQRNTTNRNTKLWNGSAWVNITYSNVTDSFAGLSSGFSNSLTFVMVLRPKYDMTFVSQTVAFTVTGGGVNTSSLTPGIILQRGVSYTFTFSNIVGWFNSGSFTPTAFDVISIPGFFWLSYSIVTTRVDDTFTYRNTTLALPTLLSKTNASFSYKIPTDFPRIANEAKIAGQNIITSYYGLKGGFTGLSPVTYYVSNTAGLISATAGTNPYIVGNGIDTTTLKIDGKNLNKDITVSASPFSYTNTTGGPIQVRVTGGTVNPIVINGVTTATATGHINTLPAGGVMTVTYTVLPTITYSDL